MKQHEFCLLFLSQTFEQFDLSTSFMVESKHQYSDTSEGIFSHSKILILMTIYGQYSVEYFCYSFCINLHKLC